MFEKIQHSRILFIGLIIVVVIFGVFKTYYTELKDRESIINELDKTFGKTAYTINLTEKRFINGSTYTVTLNDYPQAPFIIWRGYSGAIVPPFLLWIEGKEPTIYYDYTRSIGELAVLDYCKTYNVKNPVVKEYVGSPPEYYINAYNDGYFLFSIDTESLVEVEKCYRDVVNFINFIEEKYPILLKNNVFTTNVCVYGLHLKGYHPDEDGRWYWHTSFYVYKSYNEKEKITPWETIHENLLSKIEE